VRRFLPDSIAGRTLLVLLFGLAFAQFASIAIYYSDRTEALASLGGSQIVERVAAISRLMERAPATERDRIVAAVNGPTLRVAWGRDSLLPDTQVDDWRIRFVKRALVAQLGAQAKDRLRLAYAETTEASPLAMPMIAPPLKRLPQADAWREGMDVHMRYMMSGMMGDMMGGMAGVAPIGRNLRISFRLDDGSWLNFAAPTEVEAPFWTPRFVLSLTVMVLTVIALSAWVVRRLTAPLAVFARAAERLGRDVNAPPLPETGPREVRQATRAFNEMQRRLRKFIDDRTRMIAAISHDLRTPITRMRLRAEFVEDPEQQAKMLNDLQEMETMIASVLAFARDEATVEPRKVVDLIALIRGICDDATEAGRSVCLTAEGEIALSCRPMALRRAFANLIDNAIKYGGEARVTVFAANGEVTVRIDDQGPGIPEGERERVFAPFYRVEGSRSRETGGAGLGLAVARTIVRAHGGDIALSNRPEGGLRVVVTLPR